VFTIPKPLVLVLAPFSYLFSTRVWQHAQILLIGAMLCPSQRTVTADAASHGTWK
jgi:hypothetical protein